MIKPCTGCGTPIERTAGTLAKHPNPYCSTGCRNKHRARNTKPSVRIDGDTVLIPLTQEQWARVDRSDYDTIPMLKENWSAAWYGKVDTFYAVRREKKVAYYMHRIVLGASPDQEINHRDFDGLNNTRQNIEFCTRSQNVSYQRKMKEAPRGACTSRYKGVAKENSKWRAYIRGMRIGLYDTQEEAALAYNAMAIEVFGRFAVLNIIDE